MNEYTSSSAFAAKHCSSLCSQSEGDEYYGEHVAKERVYSGLMAFSRHVRGPHFASKVSYNAGAPSYAHEIP